MYYQKKNNKKYFNNNEPEIVLTYHAKQRMKERQFNWNDIRKAIKFGTFIQDCRIQYNNIVLIREILPNNKVLIITLYYTSDYALTPYEKNTWMQIYNMMENTNMAMNDVEDFFYDIETQYNSNRSKTKISFDELLLFDDILVNDLPDRTIKIINKKELSLVGWAIIRGNVAALNILVNYYNISLIKGKVFSPLHKVARHMKSPRWFDLTYDQVQQISAGTIKSINYLAELFGNDPDTFHNILDYKCDNHTLLHRALYYGHDELSFCLIKLGANLYEKSKYNESITELVMDLVEYLPKTKKYLDSM